MPTAALCSPLLAGLPLTSDHSNRKSFGFPAVQRRRSDNLLCWAAGGKGHRRRAGKPGDDLTPEGSGLHRCPHTRRVIGMFEVKDVSPPPRILGIHSLPPDTHNGDQIEVEGQVEKQLQLWL